MVYTLSPRAFKGLNVRTRLFGVLIAVAAWLLMPDTANATIIVYDEDTGLEYLYDGSADDAPNDKDNWYILVGGSSISNVFNTKTGETVNIGITRYLCDDNLRPGYRKEMYGDKSKWLRHTSDNKGLDDWTKITVTRNTPTTYQGIEYFQNVEELTINSGGASSVRLDLSYNKKLKKLTFANTNIKLTHMNISNTQLTSSTFTMPTGCVSNLNDFYARNCTSFNGTIDFSDYTVLRTIDIANSPDMQLTLSASSRASVKWLDLSGNKKLSNQLDFRQYYDLVELILKDITTFSGGGESFVQPLLLPTTKTILMRLDLRGTNLGSIYTHENALDLTEYTKLTSHIDDAFIGYDDQGENKFTRYYNPELTEENPKGNLKIYNSASEYYTIHAKDLEDGSKSVDLSKGTDEDPNKWSKLKGIRVIGDVETVIIPSGRKSFSVEATNAPNLHIDFSDQTLLTTLFIDDINSIDVSKCIALEELSYHGKLSKKLTLSADNTKLTILSVRNSGVTTLDLSNGEAPNLTTVVTSLSDVEVLKLNNHEKLISLSTFPSDDYIESNIAGKYEEFSANYKLHYVDVSGCTGLGTLELTNSESWKMYCNIDTVIAKGCTGITKFRCYNSLLTHLDLSDCTSLERLEMSQGLLTGEDDINLGNCPALNTFIAHRHRWKTLEFLTNPNHKFQPKPEQLTQIQVNGGSYTLQHNDGTPYLRNDSLLYTCRLTKLDCSHLKNGTFTKLLCEDNLLTELDISNVASGIKEIQIARNMLVTLDLHELNPQILTNEARWSPQVGYLSTELVRAKGDGEEARKKDWIAIHLENTGGYSHELDNSFYAYTNLWQSRNDVMEDGKNKYAIFTEAKPVMCTVEEANGDTYADIFNHPNFVTDGHSGQHIFVVRLNDWLTEKGTYTDMDLCGKLLTGKFNTGFNQAYDEDNHKPKLDDEGNINLTYSGIRYDPHIEVRAHLWPHIITVNPLTKSGTGVDYYSSTLILDYDAVIPEGVECYVLNGITKDKQVGDTTNVGDGYYFDMQLFGGDGSENKILPANTPVYIRSQKEVGYFDFQPIWQFDYLGWENLRGTDYHTLHGVESETTRSIKAEYVAPLTAANELKDRMNNYLSGWLPIKHKTTDMENQYYNVDSIATLTVERRSVLTLGRSTRPETSGAIGFWPYNGTSIQPYRCYVTEDNYHAMKAAAGDENSDGLRFHFDNSEATGIKTIGNEQLTTDNSDDSWYTINGMKLQQKPTEKGIYINKGKKIVIR